MNNVNLSKSKYCSAKACFKKLWMSKYKKEEAVQKGRDAIFKNGTKVGQFAKGIFGKYEDIEYNEDLNVMIEKTKQLMEYKPNIITEASFIYDNNFCSVDILKNDKDGIEIYEVKSSTEVKDTHIDDISYQYYVLTNLGYKIKKACLVYINNKYVRHGKLEIDKLFNIEDLTEKAKSRLDEIQLNIKVINSFMEEYTKDNEPESKLGMHCKDPYWCDYWEYCTKDIPKHNVFDINKMDWIKKFEKYREGKICFKDLQNENLNNRFQEQIDFEVDNLEPKINVEAIKQIMDSLKYPLYFIDYETIQLAIPEYEGTWPYQQLPFQYSLHIIEKEGAEIEHKEFLADAYDKDFLRNFVESMIKDMPDNGSVIIYNSSFEPVINRQLAQMFPDLENELTRINENIVDFQVPFRSRDYYVKEMEGSYSIKKVLPALYPDDPDLDYHNLPYVHNGTEASDSFLNMKHMSKEEQEEIRKGLLVYCGLDTYAMVKIWKKFKEIIGE